MIPRRTVLPALLLAGATLLAYANGLTADFTYDDKAIVRDNLLIRDPSTLGQIFETSYFGGRRGTGTAYRPVLLLSFALQWWLHGGEAASFHAVNLLLHLAATFLLWSLWHRVGVPGPTAFGASLLFALHPIHVEAVTSLVGRGETQTAVLTLAYLHVALRWRERSRAAGLPAAAFLLYGLALLTKEGGAVAPAIALLLFFRLEQGSPGRRLRLALRRGAPLLLGSAAVLGLVFALRGWVLGGALRGSSTGIFTLENPLAPLSPLARGANACVLALRYLGRILLPLRLSIDESAWALPPTPAGSPVALAAVVLLAAGLFLSLRRALSLEGFGFLFFGLALLPASNLLFPIGTIFAERVAYLPSAGICLIASLLLLNRGEDAARSLPLRRVFVALAIALAARTAIRNTVWREDEALFASALRASPQSAKAHYNQAYVLASGRKNRAALAEYERATDIYPGYWDAWAGRGRVELELKDLPRAEASLRRSLAIAPGYPNGFFGLGLVLESRGRLAEAESVYRAGRRKAPRSLPLAFRLATVQSRLGLPHAERTWREALRLSPSALSVRLGYSDWLRMRGEETAGRRELREILTSNGAHVPALRRLADSDAARGLAFGEALARERIFRITGWPGDLALLRLSAARSPDYAPRLRSLERELARRAPWALPAAARFLEDAREEEPPFSPRSPTRAPASSG